MTSYSELQAEVGNQAEDKLMHVNNTSWKRNEDRIVRYCNIWASRCAQNKQCNMHMLNYGTIYCAHVMLCIIKATINIPIKNLEPKIEPSENPPPPIKVLRFIRWRSILALDNFSWNREESSASVLYKCTMQKACMMMKSMCNLI